MSLFVSLEPLVVWFSRFRRSFPWRENPSPYGVVVSELMLQQTQASRVIPFFVQWMEQFPSFEALANASEEKVLKTWEGLGYYSRARALHAMANVIVGQYGGIIPSGEAQLRSLPGIGPYTAGAVRAFAFHQRAAAVDANVKRVMGRLVQETDPGALSLIVEKMLPEKNPWYAMEALIELGALVCKPKPLCEVCPLADACAARLSGTEYTFVRKSVPRTKLWRDVAVFVCQNTVFLVRTGGRNVMGGLYEFPWFDSQEGGRASEAFEALLASQISAQFRSLSALERVTHSFTRFFATLYPVVIQIDRPFEWPSGNWVSLDRVGDLPLSSGHRRVFLSLMTSRRS